MKFSVNVIKQKTKHYVVYSRFYNVKTFYLLPHTYLRIKSVINSTQVIVLSICISFILHTPTLSTSIVGKLKNSLKVKWPKVICDTFHIICTVCWLIYCVILLLLRFCIMMLCFKFIPIYVCVNNLRCYIHLYFIYTSSIFLMMKLF